jgi:MATE family multidrug resistance protein
VSDQIIDKTQQPTALVGASLFQRIRQEWTTLLALGSPILIGQLAQMSNGVIDTIMAGRADAEDLTGVAIGNNLWVPIFLFFMGLLNATQPLISGHRGAKQDHKIMPVTWNAIYIALGASVLAFFLLKNVDPILSLIGLEPSAAEITIGYLDAFVFGIPALLILIALRGLTDGIGNTKVFMVFSILTACFNAPLNYIFIFGKLGVPAMGGVGCGWATAISQWITLFLLLIYINRAKAFKAFHLWQHRMRPALPTIKEILKLGIPIGFTIFVESVMFAVVALLIASLGTEVVAGHQIALNVVSVLFMVPLSLGLALTIRISFLIGANNPRTAKLAGRSSLILVLLIAAVYALLLVLFSEQIAGLYTTEQAVKDVAILLLAYGAMFQLADVLQVVAISALRGYKDTKIPMYIMLSSFWGIGIPLGYVLAHTDWIVPNMGAPGFWIGLIAGLSHAAAWLIPRLFWFSRKAVERAA